MSLKIALLGKHLQDWQWLNVLPLLRSSGANNIEITLQHYYDVETLQLFCKLILGNEATNITVRVVSSPADFFANEEAQSYDLITILGHVGVVGEDQQANQHLLQLICQLQSPQVLAGIQFYHSHRPCPYAPSRGRGLTCTMGL